MGFDIERAKRGVAYSLKLGIAKSREIEGSSIFGKEASDLNTIGARVMESLFKNSDSTSTLVNLFKLVKPDSDPYVNAEQSGRLLDFSTRGAKVIFNTELKDKLVETEAHEICIRLSDLLCWQISQPGHGICFERATEWEPEPINETVRELDAFWLSDKENEENLAVELKRRKK